MIFVLILIIYMIFARHETFEHSYSNSYLEPISDKANRGNAVKIENLRPTSVLSEKNNQNTSINAKQTLDHRTLNPIQSPILKIANIENIATVPNTNFVGNKFVDLAEGIKLNQIRLIKHQEIVKLLAGIHLDNGFNLYKGKFDCMAVRGDSAILYEVKTILDIFSDEERQSVKAIGQLKYYKYEVIEQHPLYKIKEVIVFSNKPDDDIIKFFCAENINVVWLSNNEFIIFNPEKRKHEKFNPTELLSKN